MIRLVAVTAGLMLSACSLSPERMAEVDEVVARHQGNIALQPQVEPVTIDSPLATLNLSARRHHLVQIEQGADALAVRIHMIRSATERIELMNYIFYSDDAGRLLLGELVDASRRGVRVRVLVDSLYSLDDHRLLAGLELIDERLEVRFYNPVFDRATLSNPAFFGAIACCFRKLNHRMHHKLIAVDGRHALIGGRNTAARYFDMDTRINFLDMEVLVTGSVVADMSADFDRYWNHERSRAVRHTREVAAVLSHDPPETLELKRAERGRFGADMAMDPSWFDDLLERAGYEVGEVTYFSDPPAKTWQLGNEVSTGVLHDLMRQARRRILIQTPYFVLSRDFERTLAEVDDEVDVIVSTNSLAATDAYPVYAISRRQRLRMIEQLGLQLYEARPYPAKIELLIRRYPQLVADKAAGIQTPMRGDPAPATRTMPGPRISVHAKLLVIDDEIAVITSHNFDPRSEYYNTENGIVVYDAAFAGALADYIETTIAPGNSWIVGMRPAGPPLIGPLNRGLARVSRSLPTLDLWPWYLTENYQPIAGAEAGKPGDAVFHDTHEPVGNMPEVVRSQRKFMTALISRMFGFLRPIM